ncbi:hypothetical protein KCP73_03575 [Salmonella enterica subsp. enterica]|nr:hypothetical protein KCP73_03575 [Salmonella enterica subsp. enterica]
MGLDAPGAGRHIAAGELKRCCGWRLRRSSSRYCCCRLASAAASVSNIPKRGMALTALVQAGAPRRRAAGGGDCRELRAGRTPLKRRWALARCPPSRTICSGGDMGYTPRAQFGAAPTKWRLSPGVAPLVTSWASAR